MRTDFIDLKEGGFDEWENAPLTEEEIRNKILDDLAENVRVILEMLDGKSTREDISDYIRNFLIKPLWKKR